MGDSCLTQKHPETEQRCPNGDTKEDTNAIDADCALVSCRQLFIFFSSKALIFRPKGLNFSKKVLIFSEKQKNPEEC